MKVPGFGLVKAKFQPDTPAAAPQQTKARLTTLIAQSARFKGDLTLNEGAKIDGTINGSVALLADSVLLISSTGVVKGDVTAPRVIVAGVIDGDVQAKYLLVRAGGKVSGTATYENITIDEGGEVTGNIARAKSGDVKLISIDPARVPASLPTEQAALAS